MGERKVLNKYYPPDFDPAKIPKRKQLKNLQMKVRMMLPMSIRCNTCGTYMYKGTKFNCRKEDVVGDTYLGLMKFRFYFKCTKCSAELVMKTDPQNCDYEMEFGASRNFEPWREADEVKVAAKKQREEEEMGDAMKALENRTMDSRMEMDILAGLDEVKSLRARQANIDQNDLLDALKRSAGQEEVAQQKTEQQLEEEDEKLIKSIVFRNSEAYVRRIDDDDDNDDDDENDDGVREEESDGEDRGGSERPDSSQNGTKKRRAFLRAPDPPHGGSHRNGEAEDGDVPADGPEFTGKRQRFTDSNSDLQKSHAKAEDASVGVTATMGTKIPSDTLLIKKLDEPKPIFELKPVKVAFAVKRKGSVDSVVKPNEAEMPRTVLSSGQKELVKPASHPQQGTSSLAGGLTLLSANYDDSDEGSQ